MIDEISVNELQIKIKKENNFILLDVRNIHEVLFSKIDSSMHIPMNEIPNRIIELDKNKNIYIYFQKQKEIYLFGPYGPRHATAGTFGFRRRLLKETSYEDEAEMAEEKHFLKNYTIPFVQLNPMKSILCFAHDANTFDKSRLLENPNPNYVKKTKLTLKNFIRDKAMAKFYTEQ